MIRKWQTNEMSFCVYRIHLSNGDIYIGATKNLGVRMQQHYSKNKKLGIDILMSGIVDEFSAVDSCSMMEQYYINLYSTTQDTDVSRGVYPTEVFPEKKIELNQHAEVFAGETVVNFMDLIQSISEITRSPKEVLIFGVLFSNLDKNNVLNINISKFCKTTGYSRTTVTRMLKDSVKCGFSIKLEIGEYFINPFIVRGTSFYSNRNFEQIQQDWEELT